ncbi:uncharacterized protein METZ01_LOCUS41874 [marine metagenome]|uniref:Uncharacterized protein n=1 Tax=marine metagenome TaxID=408172 RepID=A0A381RBJ4_9ZZZZ
MLRIVTEMATREKASRAWKVNCSSDVAHW